MAVYHAIRNAQEATAPDGAVTVEVEPNGTRCVVRISDTGKGMDEEFVRDRLFRPFDSTKGASGMGIGAYQIRETIRAVGGFVDVQSALGTGTCLTLDMPMEAQESLSTTAGQYGLAASESEQRTIERT